MPIVLSCEEDVLESSLEGAADNTRKRMLRPKMCTVIK